MHEDTGIYGNFAAGLMEDEALETDTWLQRQLDGIETESYFYAFEAGIEHKWHSLGKTTLYGQYYRNEGGSQDRGVGTVATIALGMIQTILITPADVCPVLADIFPRKSRLTAWCHPGDRCSCDACLRHLPSLQR